MIRVHVEPYYPVDGVKVAIVQDIGVPGAPVSVLRMERDMQRWEPLDPAVEASPSFYLTDDVARPLLDALVRHYHGGEDTRQLRKDYDDERRRVDTFIRHLTGGAS